jgi:hypothetical protein
MGAPAGLTPPGGIDGRGARSALHHHSIEIGSRRSNSSAGNFCATRSNAGTDGSQAFAVGAISAGDDRPRSRPAVLRGPSAARMRRSPLLIRALHVGGRGWHHHGRERGPAALADRAEARGSEKSERKLAVSAISEGDSFFLRRQAHPRMRKATTTNQHNPRRGRKPRKVSKKTLVLSMVSSRRGVPTGCADGRHRCRHNCRHYRRHQEAPEFSRREIG